MKRNPGIVRELDNWSRWVTSGNSVGTGYPRAVNFLRMDRGHGGDAIPVDSVMAVKMDEAIKSLIGRQSHLHLVIMHHYRDLREIKQVALRMRQSESTIRNYLCQADALLELWLQEDSRRKRQLPVHTPAQPSVQKK